MEDEVDFLITRVFPIFSLIWRWPAIMGIHKNRSGFGNMLTVTSFIKYKDIHEKAVPVMDFRNDLI